jgi:murein DD-endopeptidase MepM/ murein hydrolase activator NlpD
MKLAPSKDELKVVDFGLLAIRQTTQGIRKSLGTSIRKNEKRDDLKESLDKRRIDAATKRDAEKVVEAKQPSNFLKGGLKKSYQGAKNIFAGLMKAAGFILMDWLLKNLPRVIVIVKEVTDFVKSFVDMVTTAFGNFTTMLKELGDVARTTWKMFTDFDFSENRRKELKKEFDEFAASANKIKTDFEGGIEEVKEKFSDMLTQSVDEINAERKRLGMAPMTEEEQAKIVEKMPQLAAAKTRLDNKEITQEQYDAEVESIMQETSPDVAPASTTSAASVTPTVPLQAGLPALPPTGTDPVYGAAQMYGYDRGGRKHAGQDFDAGPNDFFYSRIGGEVMRVLHDPGGYGHYVDIYNSQLNVTERVAEGDRTLVKVGQMIAPGTPVQQGTHQTGVFHYEIRKGKAETYGFSGTHNPLTFLNNLKSKPQLQSNIESGSTQVTAADIQPAEREVEVVNVPIDMPPKASLNSGGDNAQASSSSSATRSDTVQRAQALNLAMT